MTTNRTEFGISSWKMFVRPAGSRKKSATAKASANTIVPAHMPPPISCLSPSSPGATCALAEMPSALKPILSDSPSAATPRMIGSRRSRCRFVHETSGSEVTSMSPFAPSFESAPPAASCSAEGLRTATAQVETPRIITPSSTAWPPIGASLAATGLPSGIGPAWGSAPFCPPPSALLSDSGRISRSRPGSLAALALGGPLPEPLHTPAGIDELLLAGVEGVALRADLHVQLGPGGARVELVPAGTVDVREHVFGMDLRLHLDQG